MILYLARHGQTEWNRLGYYSGQLDVPMNETGCRQIEDLARRWRADWTQIWSSPLTRALQTVKILQKGRAEGIPLRREPLLLETDFGRWAGKSWKQVASEDPAGWSAYCADWREGIPGGGESFRQMLGRAGQLAKCLNAEPSDQRILLTAHEGILKALLLELLELPEDAFWRLALTQGTVTTLEAVGDPPYWVLQGLNG